jgi:hypothetical protein
MTLNKSYESFILFFNNSKKDEVLIQCKESLNLMTNQEKLI